MTFTPKDKEYLLSSQFKDQYLPKPNPFIEVIKSGQRQFMSLPINIFGPQGFARLRDLIFVMEMDHKQVNATKIKIIASVGLFPLSILCNFMIQKAIPAFGQRRFHNYVIDAVWHIGALFVFMKVNLSFTQSEEFISYKNKLLQKRDAKYLSCLREINEQFKIKYDDLLYTTKNQQEIDILKKECTKMAQEEQLKKRYQLILNVRQKKL